MARLITGLDAARVRENAARVRYNTFSALMVRFCDVKTHLRSFARIGAYWYYTLIFRKEVYKKHGMRFGLH